LSEYCDLIGEYSPTIDVEATSTPLIVDVEGEYEPIDVVGEYDTSYIEAEGSI